MSEISEKKKELYEQNLFLSTINPSESIYVSAPEPKPYHTNVKYMRLPCSKFDDPDIFLDAYMRNGNSAMKSLCLAGISKKMRNDYDDMLKIVTHVPEAARHVGEEICLVSRREFFSEALKQNPNVYHHLSEEMQKEKCIIDAYAIGMWSSGCRYIDRDDGRWYIDEYLSEPQETIPVFQNAISDKCDKSIFYSAENYGLAHLHMLTEGLSTFTYRGDPRNYDEINKYNPAIAFLQNARIEAEKSGNKALLEEYKLVEAKNIEICIDLLAKEVRKNPNTEYAKNIAEAVARSVAILEEKEGKIREENLSPMPSLMLDKIVAAEKEHYVERGQLLREKITAYNRDNKSGYLSTDIDCDMELAATHPEMGIGKDEQSAWWEKRGEDFRSLRENYPEEWNLSYSNELHYFINLSKEHEEMRTGEQLTIDGFDKEQEAPTISDNR